MNKNKPRRLEEPQKPAFQSDQVNERLPDVSTRRHKCLQTRLGVMIGKTGRSPGLFLLAGMFLLLTGIGAFFLLYYVKSELGIDIFPDRHLKDVLSP